MSAMCFESAHAFRAHFASGSHEFCQMICRRYLEYYQLLQASLEEDDATDLAESWTYRNNSAQLKATDTDLLETVQVLTARNLYKNALIESRCKVARWFFDSRCYKLNPRGPNSNICFRANGAVLFGQI